MKSRLCLGGIMFVVAAGLAVACFAGAAGGGGQASACVSWEQAKLDKADWGEMRIFFTGETYGTQNAYTAMATVAPGKAVHAAHQHAEEEHLVLMEGSGTWHLDGKDFAAKEGDVLYIAPWIMHGLVNTSDAPLVFLVV
ncbi:MAG: cupin domain-containing protein, partial [Candidatus Hydrogenedentes bacterium]|nr:cupin domain-containing protein [Candidatus Hydrogenedentota bacterium]